jgi:hypothetical protein
MQAYKVLLEKSLSIHSAFPSKNFIPQSSYRCILTFLTVKVYGIIIMKNEIVGAIHELPLRDIKLVESFEESNS